MSSSHTLFEKYKAVTTAGLELELADVCIAFFKKKKNSHNDKYVYEYFRVGGVEKIFSFKKY